MIDDKNIHGVSGDTKVVMNVYEDDESVFKTFSIRELYCLYPDIPKRIPSIDVVFGYKKKIRTIFDFTDIVDIVKNKPTELYQLLLDDENDTSIITTQYQEFMVCEENTNQIVYKSCQQIMEYLHYHRILPVVCSEIDEYGNDLQQGYTSTISKIRKIGIGESYQLVRLSEDDGSILNGIISK